MNVAEYKKVQAHLSLEKDDTIRLAGELLKMQREGKILLYTHIANETYTPYMSVKRKNTAMGVRPGIQDFIIVTHDTVLFLELKRFKNGTESSHQKLWREHVHNKKAITSICRGFDEALKCVEDLIA